MADTFVRQDGAGTLSPDKRRVSTQDINNMRKHINESVDERIHELVGQKHAVIRGGVVTINGGDDEKFDLEETMVSIHGQRVKVPAQAAITPGGVAGTRFVVLRYNLNESREVTISATPFDLDKQDGFALEGRDADAGAGEIRLATLTMSGATISTVVSNLDNLRVDIPANARILTVNTGEIKSVLNVETGDSRYQVIGTVIPGPDPGIVNGNMEHWQANTSVPASPSLQYFADLFQYVRSGPQIHTISRSTDAPDVPTDGAAAGANFSILLDVTTENGTLDATDFTTFLYRMEGLDFKAYFGQTFALTFFVKSPLTGTYTVAFRNRSATFRSYVAEYTIDVANTWEKKTIIVVHDTAETWDLDENFGMLIFWSLAGGSNFQTGSPGQWNNGDFRTTAAAVNIDVSDSNTFRLAQVSMSLGPTAKNNLKEDATELQRIRRYFQTWENLRMGFFKATSGAQFLWPVPYGVVMRVAPTIAISNITGVGGISSPTANTVSKEQTSILLSSTNASDENVNSTFDMQASARG